MSSSRTRAVGVVMAIVYTVVAFPAIRAMGWPTTTAAQVALWSVPLVAGALLFVLSDTYGWWDGTHRAIRRLESSADYAAIIALDPPLAAPRAQLYRLLDSSTVAVAGAVTGHYETAVRHAEAAGRRFSTLGARYASAAAMMDRVRAQALLALGRFSEVASVLEGADPLGRNVRAQAAMEVGDDDHAERLLADEAATLLDEAGRLRILGDLHIRRGRRSEGVALVDAALEIYDTNDAPVDAAYCHMHLAEADLEAGRPHAAIERLQRALAGVGGARNDNVAGLAHVTGHLARAHAAAGDVAQAHGHAEEAMTLAEKTDSPALRAFAHYARAAAAVAGGDIAEGRSSLLLAADLLRSIGARPDLERIEAELARVDGGAS